MPTRTFYGRCLLLVALGAPSVFIGCKAASRGSGGSGTTSVSTSTDAGGGPSADETDTANRGSDGGVSIQEALLLADSMFQFDPTINPASTPAQNAQAIGNQTKSLGGACAMVTTAGNTVTANFGAPPGCKLSNGLTVSGTASATVSASGGTTAVALAFTNVVVNTRALSGTISFTTTNGTSFQTTFALTAGPMLTGMVAITGSPTGFTFNGNVSVVATDATTSLTLNNVAYVTGDCYPSGGSMAITKGNTSETITFSATSATTGKVTVTIGKRSFPSTLPAYGQCPASGG
jgi:hypothetical protein